jgi:hypothetical protein
MAQLQARALVIKRWMNGRISDIGYRISCLQSRGMHVRDNLAPERLSCDARIGRRTGFELKDGTVTCTLSARLGVVLACGGFNRAPEWHIDRTAAAARFDATPAQHR